MTFRTPVVRQNLLPGIVWFTLAVCIRRYNGEDSCRDNFTPAYPAKTPIGMVPMLLSQSCPPRTAILRICGWTRLLAALMLACCNAAYGDDSTKDFFEARIRPVLIQQCQNCHGNKKQSGGLRLDRRDSFLRGGDSGPIVVAGKPTDSLLIQALRHLGDTAMPPEAKLPETTIRHFEHWIQQGAPWPSSAKADQKPVSRQQGDKGAHHWAFQPVQKPDVPETTSHDQSGNKVNRNENPTSPIDAFVQRKLSEYDLRRSSRAERRSLIRRLTYSLTGLPPSQDEVHQYLNDNAPEAYERLVERLLNSAHYGAHWARHWLDVSRYSDTKGYVYGREERFWPHAWAYRDWVVRSLNDDMPYDRFLLLQLAADQVQDRQPDDLAAMGFLTLGRRFLGVRREIIDDRIDVVSRGMMGLTVSCARCHDHKFDPIPAADYYSLYGVFDSCMEQLVPLGSNNLQHGTSAEQQNTADNFEIELKKREAKLAAQMAVRRAEAESRIRQRAADYLFAQSELEKFPANGFDQIFEPNDLLPAVVRRWSNHLRNTAKQDDLIFVYWRRFASIAPQRFSQQSTQITQQLNSEYGKIANPRIAKQFATPPSSLREVCNRYGEALAAVAVEWKTLIEKAQAENKPTPLSMSDPHAESLRILLYGPDSPCRIPTGSIIDCETYFDSSVCTELWKLQGEVDRWIIQSPHNQPFALTLQDLPRPREPRIFKRGDPLKLGRDVPRQFLSAVAGQNRQPFQQGSGRLELAKAIIDSANPLTARVIVNRVWMHHFGKGLVTTPSDFGTRADPPSHPDLLDWLTTNFMDNQWSLKSLHRRIVLSETYQQSSTGPEDNDQLQKSLQTDPDNRLLWKFNPQRLGFEELRDSILMASGQLDGTLGGKPSQLFKTPYPTRRTLYGLVDRQYLPGTLRVFDFANPDLHVPKRSETTVPQQALFFMNHPWMLQQARNLAEQIRRSNDESGLNHRQRVAKLFQLILQRVPTEQEYSDSLSLIAAITEKTDVQDKPTRRNWSYGYGPFDEAKSRVNQFTPLPHFTGTVWQGGQQFPDPTLGWAQLTSTGGHPGNDRQHAVIRRWTAERDMRIRIESKIAHKPEMGDGIRAFITSSSGGLHHSIELHHANRQLDVETLDIKSGDVVDFIVDIGDGLNNDQYLWTTTIQELGSNGTTWNSQADFPPPIANTLDGWEQLAQVLLCSNEFMFID
jgi:hypothetical protein